MVSLNLSLYDIIRRPLITEKTNICSSLNKYFFVVDSSANKKNITHAVEKIFNVKVSHVNIINKKRVITFFKGKKGFRSAYKKAIVTLKDGSIDLTSEVK